MKLHQRAIFPQEASSQIFDKEIKGKICPNQRFFIPLKKS
jgi:Na+-translocating ferredoxin:NAD+ oxidoreductase RnfC subunit